MPHWLFEKCQLVAGAQRHVDSMQLADFAEASTDVNTRAILGPAAKGCSSYILIPSQALADFWWNLRYATKYDVTVVGGAHDDFSIS